MVTNLFDAQPAKRNSPPAPTEPTAKFIESCDAFGWLANERDRAVMLEIRHATGDITALPYPLLESAKFNPSTGIVLSFAGTTVTVTGTSLNTDVQASIRLFEGITRHRVVWIQEMDATRSSQRSTTELIIDEISITD
jgi:hypothetical protein